MGDNTLCLYAVSYKKKDQWTMTGHAYITKSNVKEMAHSLLSQHQFEDAIRIERIGKSDEVIELTRADIRKAPEPPTRKGKKQ